MRVSPIGSNQTVVEINRDIDILFSYRTAVAACIAGVGYFRTREFYSTTTSKHINKWLAGANATKVDQELIERIAEGDIAWLEEYENDAKPV